MPHRYLQLDVFAARAGTGNPLGVVFEAGEMDTATMQALQDYTRLKRTGRAQAAAEPDDLAWSLVLDALVFDAYGTLFDVQSLAARCEAYWPGHGAAVSAL